MPLIKLLHTLPYLQRIADSLTDVVLSQTESYNNNIDEVIRDCNKAVRIALKTGYKQALDSFSTIQLPPDTIHNCDELELDLSDFQQRLRIAQGEVIKVTAERDIYKKQANRWWLYLLIGLAVGATVVKLTGLFKPKIKV